MDITIGIPTTSSILAVKATAIDGLLTSLNPNLTIDDCFIAELSLGDGSAIFAEGASLTSRTVESGETEKAISAFTYGLPSGNYKIRTSTDAANPTSWSEQSEVAKQNIINEDIVTLFVLALTSSVSGNLLRFDGTNGRTIEDSGVSIQTSGTTSFSDSDLKIITDKFIKTLLGSTASGKGASLIGLYDSAGNFTATNVEAALAELMGKIANNTIDLTSKTCSMLATYYSNLERVRATTPPITDASGNAGVGIYRFQYVFKNATVATPSSGITWATEATEISNPENFMEAPVPENGDALYSGGTAGYAYFYCRVRFENNSSVDNITDWAYLDPGVTIAEPELLADKIVEVLGENGTDAQKVTSILKAAIANSPTAQSLQQSALTNLHTSDAGAPSGTPTSLGQTYVNETNGDIYNASYDGSDYSWVLIYDAP